MWLNCTSSTENSRPGISGEVPRRTGSASEWVCKLPSDFCWQRLADVWLERKKTKKQNRRGHLRTPPDWRTSQCIFLFLFSLIRKNTVNQMSQRVSASRRLVSAITHIHTRTHPCFIASPRKPKNIPSSFKRLGRPFHPRKRGRARKVKVKVLHRTSSGCSSSPLLRVSF